jgi:hypothetical protein
MLGRGKIAHNKLLMTHVHEKAQIILSVGNAQVISGHLGASETYLLSLLILGAFAIFLTRDHIAQHSYVTKHWMVPINMYNFCVKNK